MAAAKWNIIMGLGRWGWGTANRNHHLLHWTAKQLNPQGMTMDISYIYAKAYRVAKSAEKKSNQHLLHFHTHFPTSTTFTHSHYTPIPSPPTLPPLSPHPHTLPTTSHSHLLQHPDPGGQLFSRGSLGALEGLPLSLQLAHLQLQPRDLRVKVPYHTLIGHTQCLQFAQCGCWKEGDQNNSNFLHR